MSQNSAFSASTPIEEDESSHIAPDLLLFLLLFLYTTSPTLLFNALRPYLPSPLIPLYLRRLLFATSSLPL
jgi:hypothetical protein